MKLSYVSLLLAATKVFAESTEDEVNDSKVVVLGEDTFADFINTKSHVLAKFYAPWCGHCKKLAPEYEAAAAFLEENTGDVSLVEVDCTDNKALCAEYEIQGFPTLIVFEDGVPVGNYQGKRSAADIISYMKKQTVPAVSEVSSVADLEDWLEKNQETEPVVVLYTGPESSKPAFDAIAKKFRDSLAFISSTDADVKSKFEDSDLVVLKLDEEPEVLAAGEELTEEAIQKFVSANRFASFEELGPDNYAAYMESEVPMFYAFVGDDSARELVKEAAKPFLKELKGKANIVFLDSNLYGPHAKNFDMEEKFPAVVVHDTVSNKKFIRSQEEDLTVENLGSFIRDFIDDKIVPFFKSQPVPESQDENVYVVVGSEYEKIVLDDDKDVLIEFYAPWCGHCKNLAPVYEELAGLYTGNDKVVVAKLDHTENEVPDKISGYPTLKLYPAGDKANPIVYDGPRNLESLQKFIEEKGTHKATPNAAEKVEEEKAAEEPAEEEAEEKVEKIEKKADKKPAKKADKKADKKAAKKAAKKEDKDEL